MLKKLKQKFYRFLIRYFLFKFIPFKIYKNWEILAGYINSDFAPLICYHCGCKTFHKGKIWKEEYLVIEYEELCDNCNKLVGHWSYGHSMP